MTHVLPFGLFRTAGFMPSNAHITCVGDENGVRSDGWRSSGRCTGQVSQATPLVTDPVHRNADAGAASPDEGVIGDVPRDVEEFAQMAHRFVVPAEARVIRLGFDVDDLIQRCSFEGGIDQWRRGEQHDKGEG